MLGATLPARRAGRPLARSASIAHALLTQNRSSGGSSPSSPLLSSPLSLLHSTKTLARSGHPRLSDRRQWAGSVATDSPPSVRPTDRRGGRRRAPRAKVGAARPGEDVVAGR